MAPAHSLRAAEGIGNLRNLSRADDRLRRTGCTSNAYLLADARGQTNPRYW